MNCNVETSEPGSADRMSTSAPYTVTYIHLSSAIDGETPRNIQNSEEEEENQEENHDEVAKKELTKVSN